MLGITAVIVSRDMGGLLSVCLRDLRANLAGLDPPRPYQIVVTDNASQPPYHPQDFKNQGAHIIRFDKHTCFAEANNLAVLRFPANYYLLLNNDVLLAEGTVEGMLAAMESSSTVGICGTRMLFPDGTIQHCGVVFGKGDQGPYHEMRTKPAHLATRRIREFQAVTGACMLIRAEVWEQLNGLDPSFPFGLEDIDFCLRARQRGWRVICHNQTDSIHFEAQTQGRVELDVSSRKLFMERWKNRYSIDG